MVENVKKVFLPIVLTGIIILQFIDALFISCLGASTDITLLVDFILPFLYFALYMSYKKDFKEQGKIMLLGFKLSLAIGLASLVFNVVHLAVGETLGTATMLSAYAIMLVAVIGFFKLKKGKTLNESLEKKDLKELLFKEKNRKNGDAKLGIDQETKQPVLLPLKDRYLHMLILGPTGSGKTSRIILPMIYDDILNEDLGVIVLEPKGDLAEKVYAMAKLTGRTVTYFNPMMKDCPYFNPLVGEEDKVIENLVTTFKMLDNGTKTFFQDNNENLIRRSVKVVKRLYGDKATLGQLEELILNASGRGLEMIRDFGLLLKDRSGKPIPESIKKENEDIISWFKDDYFTGATGQRGGTKTYENTSGVRNQLSKLNANSYLRKVLNPPMDLELTPENSIDFSKCLAEGNIITMCSAQGSLRDLGKFLGYFLILQLQTATLSRPGNEDTRRGCMLYIDEFQTYANSGFSVMLEQGRSYRVASHLATQTRAAIGMGSGNMGRDFIQIVSANCRNVVLFHDVNVDDALYYSKAFGQKMEQIKQYGVTRQKGLIRRIFNYTGENEQIRYTEQLQPRFTDSDIMYGPPDEIIYKIIIDMAVQTPGRSKVSWLPWELTQKINKTVDEYNEKNVINKNDYNEEIINRNFDETNKYQGDATAGEFVAPVFEFEDAAVKEKNNRNFIASNVSNEEESAANASALDIFKQNSNIKVPETSQETGQSRAVEIDDA